MGRVCKGANKKPRQKLAGPTRFCKRFASPTRCSQKKPEEPKLNWRLLVPHRHRQDRWRPPAFTRLTILGRSFRVLWSVCPPEAEVDVTHSRDIASPHRIFSDPGRDRLATVLNS